MKKFFKLLLTVLSMAVIIFGIVCGVRAIKDSHTKVEDTPQENVAQEQGESVIVSEGKGVFKITSYVKINGETTYNVLPGVKYQLLSEEGEKTFLEIEAKTGKDGQLVFTGIKDGRYYVRATEVPEGYVLDEQLYKFTVDKDNVTFNLTAGYDQANETRIVVEVIDTDEKPVAGAEFDVYAINGEEKTLINHLETKTKGLCGLKNLPYGYYELVQTKYPEGYQDLKIKKIVQLTPENPTVENVKVMMVKAE